MTTIKIPVSEGIISRFVEVNGIKLHLLEHGKNNATTKIMMIHGNVAAATWWEEIMLALDEDRYHSVAIDLRGYGESQAAPVDATRGLRDYSDDIHAVIQNLGWKHYHFIGHSLGGSIGYTYLIDHSDEVLSTTLIAPGSPYGFGGTKDAKGTPCFDDYAGSGGGLRNEDYLKMMKENYRKADHPLAPLSRLRATVFKPPFIHPREDAILDALNATHLSDHNYPGDFVPSPNWTSFAPGDKGVNNALSPKYDKGYEIINIAGNKPPILWLRGADDTLVSNQSLADMGTLGKMGFVPGYPGDDVFPSQPMLNQTRAVLDQYQTAGGSYQEHVFADCGHSPQAEKFDEFMPLFSAFIDDHQP